MKAKFDLEKFFESGFRIFFIWFFGDVAFAIIPIATIALITRLLGHSFHDILLIKEWSFATIVFFGVSIRKLIRLKVELQHTPTSYKLDTGVQLYIVLVIASVLILALVILNEKGGLAIQNPTVLGVTQLMLFILGLGSIFSAVLAEQKVYDEVNSLPDGISPHWLFRRIMSELDETGDSLEWVVYAIERVSSLEFAGRINQRIAKVEQEKLFFALRGSLERLDMINSSGKKQLETLRTKIDRNAAVSNLPTDTTNISQKAENVGVPTS
jgi:hypothetical protein